MAQTNVSPATHTTYHFITGKNQTLHLYSIMRIMNILAITNNGVIFAVQSEND